ncbi:hypothetical protein ACYRFS_11830 [Listeria kieliensis]
MAKLSVDERSEIRREALFHGSCKRYEKSRVLGVDRRLGSRYDMAIAFAIFSRNDLFFRRTAYK